MTRQRTRLLRVARLLVAIASVLVPRRRRSEWRREWDAELWVASARGRPVIRDALGSFHHAVALRRYRSFAESPAHPRTSAPTLFSWVDVKLGMRMLVKYPVLSLVSVVGMATAIGIGAGVFSIMAALTSSSLPLPDGDRVVALRNAIITEPGRHLTSLRDYLAWRDQLTSVQDLAAFTTTHRTLVAPGVAVDLVRVTRMTASGFDVARTTPLMGRPLLAEDERDDARVVVIAFDEWQRRFGADPDVIGRRVRLGSEEYEIVGVMPEGFGYPIDDRYWVPFVATPAQRERADAIEVTIAGRLAMHATLESAQAELTAVGTHMAAAYPGTHEWLRPRVTSYTRAFFDMDGPEQLWTAHLFRLFVSLLLVVVAANVAILIYARTASRAGEIAVRTALGASRRRVAMQLFAEALVLSGTAAAIGLTISSVALRELEIVAARTLGVLPFWVDLGLSPGVITYAVVLALVGATIVGVVPALKATGRDVHSSLQQLAGRGTHMQLGRSWTTLIIAQVAIAVAVLPFTVHFAEEVLADATHDAGFPVDEYLLASVAMEDTDASHDTSAAATHAREQRFRVRATELIRRLEADPAVAGLTIRSAGHERIEVAPQGDDQPLIGAGGTGFDRVSPGFFEVFGMPIVAGRGFVEADTHGGATAVIVNQVFAERVSGDRGVLRRRLRVVSESDVDGRVEAGAWLDIVGVVRDPQTMAYEPSNRIYLPANIAQLEPPINLALRMRTARPASFAPHLRDIAASVDPMLQLDGVVSAAERQRQGRQFLRWLAIGTTAVMLSVLLLSAAGVYAMMSFTVARRRREIGIRSALGAAPRRVLSGIFARAAAQLAAGILIGLAGSVAVDRLAGRGPVNDGNASVLLLVVVLMTTVGLIAAVDPARRALAVQPTEALRGE